MALYFSAPNSGVPLLPRYAIEGDRDAGRVLVHGTKTAFTAAVQPYWADIRANHHSELAQHGRLLARRGIRAALTTVIPGASWCGDCLRIPSPQDHTVRLGGRGLVITPTAFWTGPPLVGELPDQLVLRAYPADRAEHPRRCRVRHPRRDPRDDPSGWMATEMAIDAPGMRGAIRHATGTKKFCAQEKPS
jgi:hypothetical protein